MLSFPANAADNNTYRPGHAYLKSAAGSFEACEQQCRGDAQCRGWNFVRPNPRSQSGICEFNERSAMPVASAISVSGEINTSIDSLMSRAVPSGSRTVRVGTPTVPVQKPAQVQRGTTNVKRMPVPTQNKAMHPSAYKKPAPQQQGIRAPRTYGGAAPAPAGPDANASQPTQQLTPQQQYYRQQFLIEQQRQQQMRARQQAAVRQQQMTRPQMGQQPQMMTPQSASPQGQQINRPGPAAQQAQVPAGPQRTIQGPMVQQSLYGSLHDDLTKNMTPVPRPQTAPDNLENPNAPVSTSRAAPTGPVETSNLQDKMDPALAGARN
jgi:hypothetical protein